MFILCLLPFPLTGDRMLALSSEYNIDQADFTYWMSFQPSTFLEEITPNPESLITSA